MSLKGLCEVTINDMRSKYLPATTRYVLMPLEYPFAKAALFARLNVERAVCKFIRSIHAISPELYLNFYSQRHNRDLLELHTQKATPWMGLRLRRVLDRPEVGLLP